jgi:endo-1,4-beta-xylanase
MPQTPLFPPDALPLTGGADGAARFTPQGTQVRIEVVKPDGAKPWSAFIKSPFFPALKKNDTLHVSVELRCLAAAPPDRRGSFNAYVQVDKGDWEGLGNVGSGVPSDGAWRTYHISAKAQKDFPEGVVNVVLHLAQQVQTLEARNLRGVNLGDVPLTSVPDNPMNYLGRERNAPWRKEAARRIEKNRKGELKLKITDTSGKTISGASVSVELKRHAFAFGSFTDYKPAEDNPDAEKYKKTMLQMFNRVTIPWYWSDWGLESEKTRKNYDKIAEWAQKSGFEIKAHCLIYPHYLPERLKKLSSAERRAEILKQATQSIKDTEKYNIAVWDVLNELRNDTDLEKEYGFEFYAEIFKTARAAGSQARFFINEYTVEGTGGAYEQNLTLYEKQIAQHLKNGAPLEGIGIQCHFGLDAPGPESLWGALDRLGRFNLPIEITEFDLGVRDDEGQADYVRDFLTACFAHPSTSSVTMWGFWEGAMWRPEAALIRKDWTPRPAFHAWQKTIAAWTTKASGRTDRTGSFGTRGFFGTYEVTVRHQGKTTKTTLQHTSGGKPQTVVLG